MGWSALHICSTEKGCKPLIPAQRPRWSVVLSVPSLEVVLETMILTELTCPSCEPPPCGRDTKTSYSNTRTRPNPTGSLASASSAPRWTRMAVDRLFHHSHIVAINVPNMLSGWCTKQLQTKGAAGPMRVFSITGIGGYHGLKLPRMEALDVELKMPIKVNFWLMNGKNHDENIY